MEMLNYVSISVQQSVVWHSHEYVMNKFGSYNVFNEYLSVVKLFVEWEKLVVLLHFKVHVFYSEYEDC